MLRGAIFDMDGLMFDTEKVYRYSWSTILLDRGLEPQEGFLQDIVGTSGQKVLDVISSYYPTLDPAEYYASVLRKVDEVTAVSLPEKPGIHEIMEYLGQNSIPIAVASSSPANLIERNLRNAGLSDLVTYRISGAQVEHGKPAPDIFLASCRALELQPEECYVFEDGINGVKAGVAAGCRTIMVPDVQQPTQEILASGVRVFGSLLEVLDALKSGEI